MGLDSGQGFFKGPGHTFVHQFLIEAVGSVDIAELVSLIAPDLDLLGQPILLGAGEIVSAESKGEVECLEILLRYLPGVIGLQECNADVHNKVLKNLPSFYEFANRTHKGSSTVNYTPIIYNNIMVIGTRDCKIYAIKIKYERKQL